MAAREAVLVCGTDLVIVSNIVQVPWYLPFLIVGFTIVQHAIENLMQNKTVIIIAHRLSTIKVGMRKRLCLPYKPVLPAALDKRG